MNKSILDYITEQILDEFPDTITHWNEVNEDFGIYISLNDAPEHATIFIYILDGCYYIDEFAHTGHWHHGSGSLSNPDSIPWILKTVYELLYYHQFKHNCHKFILAKQLGASHE